MPTKRIPTIRVIWYDKGPQDQSGLLIEQDLQSAINVQMDFSSIDKMQ